MNLQKLCLIAGFVLVTASTAWADISGSPLVNYGNVDTCVGCVFPIIQFTAANAGQTVSSYSFFDGDAQGPSEAGHAITPLLFEESSPGTFTIIGIGQGLVGLFQDTINANIPFVLVSGTATVQGANTFFGYVDGLANGAEVNAGSISMSYPPDGAGGIGGPVQYFLDPPFNGPSDALAVNDSATFSTFVGAGQSTRTYALEVTTTPEPGFYGLLAIGLGALGFAIRRRPV